MNLSNKDYGKLYQLQDKFLIWFKTLGLPFYLTGGTALGRFYLNHRYSEDLDFFMNSDSAYLPAVTELKKNIGLHFSVNTLQSLFSDDFTRLFISDGNIHMKLDFINYVAYYDGAPLPFLYGSIDHPKNILSNKLSAIIGRDEPKDIFDIIHIALNYSFNWNDVFDIAKKKAAINELNIEERLHSFPIELLYSVDWLISPLDKESTSRILRKIADDFLLGADNSLGINKLPIELAKPL